MLTKKIRAARKLPTPSPDNFSNGPFLSYLSLSRQHQTQILKFSVIKILYVTNAYIALSLCYEILFCIVTWQKSVQYKYK